MVKISGKLIDGAGEVMENTIIELRSLKNTSVVLNKATSVSTAKDGSYSINAQLGEYDVIILREGYAPAHVGTIHIYADSKEGSLNDFLLNPNESEITPELLAQLTNERKQSQQAATNAQKSATQASITLNNTVKKMGDTMSGGLSAPFFQSSLFRLDPSNKIDLSLQETNDSKNWLIGLETIDSSKGNDTTKTGITDYCTILKVKIGATRHMQLAVDGNTNKFWVRGLRSDRPQQIKFSKVYTDTDRPTANDIGALPLTGGTLNGDVFIEKTTPRLYLTDKETKNGCALLSTNSDFRFYSLKDTANHVLSYNYNTKNWNFTNSTVTINNIPVLKQGDYGLFLGTQGLSYIDSDEQLSKMVSGQRFFAKNRNNSILPSNIHGYLIKTGARDNSYGGSFIFAEYIENGAIYHGTQLGNLKTIVWQKLLTTANSTIDSNGVYKKASPICRLYTNDNINEVEGFKKAGCGLINNEADGVTAKRIDIGHYEIHGSLGFAKDGWYITLPEDANGNKKVFVEYSTDQNNVITVNTYEHCFDNGRFVAGKPMDVPLGRWIDIRLEMPAKITELDPQSI